MISFPGVLGEAFGAGRCDESFSKNPLFDQTLVFTDRKSVV